MNHSFSWRFLSSAIKLYVARVIATCSAKGMMMDFSCHRVILLLYNEFLSESVGFISQQFFETATM